MFFHGFPFIVPDLQLDNGNQLVYECVNALGAIREGNELKAEAIFQSIILVKTHFPLECMIYELDWDLRQESFANECEAFFAAVQSLELMDLAKRRMTHQKKKERATKTSIVDMRVASLLAVIIDLPADFETFLEGEFSLKYEAPDTS